MSDALATHFPVSVKAIVETNDGFVLLKNERDEWELPGGKLENGEDLRPCAVREILEESGLVIEIQSLAHSWVYRVNGCDVVIIAYKARKITEETTLSLSTEHKEIGVFLAGLIAQLNMPQGYKDAIELSISLDEYA